MDLSETRSARRRHLRPIETACRNLLYRQSVPGHTMTNYTMTSDTMIKPVATRVVCCLLVLVLVCTGIPSVIASGSESLSALNQGRLKTIYVEHVDGWETTGRFVSSTDSELVLIVDGARQVLPVQDIRQVSVMKRATWKGFWIGYLVGALLGGLSTQGAPCADCGKGLAMTMGAIGTGLGALAGYRSQHKEVVYSAPASSVS